MSAPTLAELAKMFDHSLLQPQLTDADLERGLPAGPRVRRRVGVHQALRREAGGEAAGRARPCRSARPSASRTAAT